MAPYSWFRLWAEFADDPKIQMMQEAMQRRFVMLLCERCKCETLHETERAFHWRITEQELAETKSLFIEKGFIDEEWHVLNWNKRQFLSDSSSERVRRHRRAKKQAESFRETDETEAHRATAVTETAPNTDTEEQNRSRPEKQRRTHGRAAHRAPALIPSTGANGEFILAQELMREIKLAGRAGDIALVGQVIANESEEHGGPLQAKDFIRDKAKDAMARGERVTLFWLQDRNFAQGKPVSERDRKKAQFMAETEEEYGETA
jgi:hypothetical protein